MKANDIQKAVLHWYYPKGKKIGVTNYNGSGLQEADILLVSETGLVYEYEVKCSLSDFKADFKKEQKHQILSDKVKREESFKNYSEGWFTCPNYFYYVCREGLIPNHLVPEYAGLIYVSEGKITVIKRGKKFHNYRATTRLYMSILKCLSARGIYGCSYMNWINKQK